MIDTQARNWFEDASHENGNYQCRCTDCGEIFIGHKRRVVCRTCAIPTKKELRAENARLREARAIVNAQAEDELLWSRPVVGLQSIQEAYLQKELRRLHEVIEGKTAEECAREALKEPSND
jgi:hypothetical protein